MYLRRGLSHGFHIGFQRDIRLNSRSKNHRSVLHNPVVVHSHVSDEMKAGRLKGSFALTQATAVHISPIGIVPKTQPGKWRLIVDLSYPQGGSVNDGIDPSVCSLKYASVDEAGEVIRRWVPGTHLAKLDLKAAKDPSLLHALRCFFFLAATFAFTYNGKWNDAADALSRNRPHQFNLSSHRQTTRQPMPVAEALHSLLLGQERMWTSQAWRQRFRDTLYEVCQGQPKGRMTQPSASTGSFATCLPLNPCPSKRQ